MVAIVSVETVLLVILVILVAGLLRSHAEILRRLGPAAEDTGETAPAPPDSTRIRNDGSVPGLSGATPTGGAIALDFEGGSAGPTLLAFLSSGCSTCAAFWQTLADRQLPPGVQTVIVAQDGDRERPSKLAALAPVGVPVVMSSQAWRDYQVPGAPYFVLVDGFVRGEGVATTWPALVSLVTDAIHEQRAAQSASRSGAERSQTVDERLLRSGIGPDHPSLRPG